MRHIILSIFVFMCVAKNNALGQYWSALGPGLGDTYNSPTVGALLMHNGELYAGGYFNIAGGQPANNIAKWNGTNWSTLGSGIENFGVHCLEVYNGEVYAGGYFSIAGGLGIIGLAKWDGNSWSSVGGSLQGGAVHAIVVHEGSLYIGGSFTQVGGIAAKNIAKWDGSNWSALGSGINGVVYALESYNDTLFAGRGITSAGDLSESTILKWDGNTWSSPGAGFDRTVNTLCTYNNALYAGGSFLYSGPVPTKFIAKWNGTTWSGVGSGMNNPVHSLYSFGNYLYAGGFFYMADTTPANGIAKWNGTTWSGLGEGLSARAITADSDAVYVGGAFIMAGSATVNAIAKWTEHCNSVPPQPGIISGDSTVCAGSAQTYSIAPVTDATSYIWTIPTGWVGTSNTNTITCIAGTSGGDISIIARNPCGNSIIQTFHVDVSGLEPPQPSPIIGNGCISYGNTETYYTDPTPGITSYTWNLPYDWIGNSTTNSITAIVGEWFGEITVVAHNDYCSSAPQTFLVTPGYFNLPQPGAIYGEKSICPGSTQIYFVNAVSTATSYTWNIPSGWSGNSATNSITVTAGSGSGEISVRANNACGVGASSSLQILFDTISPKLGPINGNAYVATGEKYGYSVDITNRPLSYNWSLSGGGGNLAVGQSPNKIEIDWQTPGTYILSVKVVNSCGISSEQELTVTVSSANEKDPYSPQLLPNPSTGKFYLKAKRIQDKIISVEVLNMSGQIIYRSGKSQGSNDYSQLINLDKMAQGIYAVKIIIDGKVYTKQILITN